MKSLTTRVSASVLRADCYPIRGEEEVNTRVPDGLAGSQPSPGLGCLYLVQSLLSRGRPYQLSRPRKGAGRFHDHPVCLTGLLCVAEEFIGRLTTNSIAGQRKYSTQLLKPAITEPPRIHARWQDGLTPDPAFVYGMQVIHLGLEVSLVSAECVGDSWAATAVGFLVGCNDAPTNRSSVVCFDFTAGGAGVFPKQTAEQLSCMYAAYVALRRARSPSYN